MKLFKKIKGVRGATKIIKKLLLKILCGIHGGDVVSSDIPPYAIAGGNPARVFKYRDIEHFKKLKSEKSIGNHMRIDG